MFRQLLLVLTVCLATLTAAHAADGKAPAGSDEFAKMYGEWKGYLAKFAQLRTRYQTDVSADKKALENEAKETMEKARDLLEPLTIAGAKAYVAAPNQNKELTAFLVGAVQGFIVKDDFEIAAKVSKILLDHQCDAPQLDYLAGIALFMTNDFDAAEKHLLAAKDKKAINEFGLRHLRLIDQCRQAWEKEKAIRAAEDQADNLPKVKLETTQGDVVLVLFENEAPNTTANFINLVETKFYDGQTFHRVIPGFMAQGGDPNGDGSGGPGYTIHDECLQENHRNHFRGSLSMAKTPEPNTAGSQFFITFAPTSHLNGKHTVFGRVVEGMRVLAKLQRTEGVPGVPGPPDKIIKATVLSKRPHAYRPIKRLDDKK
ncbi:MAG: peptidylprolyl isomerase [Pirellulales bacterium]